MVTDGKIYKPSNWCPRNNGEELVSATYEIWLPAFSRHSTPQIRIEVISMETGKVKWFDLERNYGFIERENGDSDVFFHGDDVESGTSLNTGDHVTFELKEGNGRPKAQKISKK